MFKKRKWIIVAALAAVVVIVGGVVGGVAYAQTTTPTTPPANNPGKDLADRVATILNLPQADVEAAFAQAQKDMQNDAVKSYLDKLVAAGKMSQTDADAYLNWLQSRPQLSTGPNVLPGMGGPGFGFRGGIRGFGGKAFTPPTNPPATTQ
jgi:uncharacterized membrane protein